MGDKKLTAKQARFCSEYLKDLNATQAAVRAGYSKHTAGVIGAENLAKPMIAAEIEKYRKREENEAIITFDEACKILTKIMHNENENTRDRIAAHTQLAKCLGWEAPKKIQDVTNPMDSLLAYIRECEQRGSR